MDNQTADERLKAAEQKLDEYENKAGLPTAMAPGSDLELNEYLTMNKDTLHGLSIQDCANISYRLGQFSLYVTRLLNNEKSNALWAEALLREMLAGVKDNYGQYTKHELKFDLLAKENTFAEKLNKILLYAKQRAQRLDNVANAINFLSRILLDVRRSKYSKESTNEQTNPY